MSHSVGVVGLGYFSQFHLAAWRNLNAATLVGTADPSEDRRRWAAETYGVATWPSASAMLAATKPEIVDIVAPPAAHKELLDLVLAPGRVVICQKPFCRDLGEAAEMVALASARQSFLLVHENIRFQPWHRTVKGFLESGAIGEVYGARFALRPGDGRGPDAYLNRQPSFQSMPRFLLHETAIHFADLFRWFFGDVTAVYADTRRLNPAIAGEDAGLMVLDHAGGARSLFDGNRLADHDSDNPRRTMGEMEIEGAGGVLRLNGLGELSFRPFGDRSSRMLPITEPIDDSVFGGGCVAAYCKHVLDEIEGQAGYEVPAAEYLHVMRVIEAAYESAEDGVKVRLI